MTTPDTNLASRVNIPLDYLLEGLKGRLDGMLSYYLSKRAFALDEITQRKLNLAKSYGGTYMQDSGFCRGLAEEVEELNMESSTIWSYLFTANERTQKHIH